MITQQAAGTRRLYCALVLARPLNCLIAAGSVAVGAFLAGRAVSPKSLTAAGMTFLACASAYVVNDYFDVIADRLVKPGRPLAAGCLTPGFAVKYAAGLWACAGILAMVTGVVSLGFLAAWTAALWLYSSGLKGGGIYGHLLVSLVASSGFLLGAAVEGRMQAGWFPAGIASVFHLARETAKAVADAAGDSATGVRTLAVRIGSGATLGVTGLLIVAGALASLVPFACGAYGVLYLLVVVAVVFPLLAIAACRIIRARRCGGRPDAAARSVAATLKAAMVVGLVAFLLAGI